MIVFSSEDLEDIAKIAKSYGEGQHAILAEECCELAVEALHHMRGRAVDVAGEIADVLVMIRQVMLLEGITDAEVGAIAHEKVQRQIGRIRDGK